MKDFNLHGFLRNNPLTAKESSKKNINEAFEGFGGVRGIAPIHEAPIQPKDFGTTQDPWGWNDNMKKMRDDEENRPNKWIMDIDRYPQPYGDWSLSWEYPGIIVWAHPDILDTVVVATPGWDGKGTPIELQTADGESMMIAVMDQDEFATFRDYVMAMKPYLDKVAKMKTGGMKETYMGTPYDSSEDMAVDMVKKGITEMPRLDRETPQDRMDGLVNQRALAKFGEIALAIAQDLEDDGFDGYEIKNFLKDKIEGLIMG